MDDDQLSLAINPEVPNAARVYDYLLGGKDNFPADREVAERVMQVAPMSRDITRQNRAFLRRVVRFLTGDAGVRQFLDIGSGLPTQGNVHEIAQAIAPDTRVVYVDNDPVVVTHGRALLAGKRTAVVRADLREPEAILQDPQVKEFLDFDRPIALLLFSGGKDSAVVLHLARKAFWPAALPFPVMHVDTGHNFPEVIEYRDRMVARMGARLIVASVQESIDNGRVVEENGPRSSRNRLQSVTLLDAIEEHGFRAAFGGARRDEERARAKERILSFRDDFGQWDPKRQRPELWSLYNGFVKPGEHVRVFPLSNWTELDVWQYVREERIELPSIYFAHRRRVFRRDGMLYATSEFVELLDGEVPFEEWVRFRTVGDMSCTGAVRSTAATLEEVVAEIAATRITERGETRADDRISEAAMEDRKKEGYF